MSKSKKIIVVKKKVIQKVKKVIHKVKQVSSLPKSRINNNININLLTNRIVNNKHVKLRSLDAYLALIFYNANKQELNIPTIINAVLSLNYQSKSSSFKTNVCSALSRMKSKKLLSKGSKHGTYLITPQGKAWLESLVSEKPQYSKQAVPVNISVNVIPPKNLLNKVKDFMLLALFNKNSIQACDLSLALKEVGFYPQGVQTDELQTCLKNSLHELIKDKLVCSKRDDKRHLWLSISPIGAKKAKTISV